MEQPRLTPALAPRERVGFGIATAVVAAVLIPIGVHKGGDILYAIGPSELLLQGLPPYEQAPPQGQWWPPFTALALVPVALLGRASLVLAKAVWAALGVAALAWAVLVARRWIGWGAIGLGLLAVGWPLWDNFQHLNVNTVLLALVVAAAADLADGRERRAGLWIGLATALKVFPGILLGYVAYRARWRALAVGLAVAVGLTYAAMLPYGPLDAVDAIGDWVSLATAGESYAGAKIAALGMQKLARLGRALGDSAAAIVALHLGVLALIVAALRGPGARERWLPEIGLVTLAAALLAPIGWLHTFTLGFAAWVAVLALPAPEARRPRAAWYAALGVTGLFTSSVLGHFTFPEPLRFVTRFNDVVGGLALLTILALQLARRRAGSPVPA